MKKSTHIQPPAGARLQPKDQSAHEREISRRAYELWQADGCRHGCDMRHWLAAEQSVRADGQP